MNKNSPVAVRVREAMRPFLVGKQSPDERLFSLAGVSYYRSPYMARATSIIYAIAFIIFIAPTIITTAIGHYFASIHVAGLPPPGPIGVYSERWLFPWLAALVREHTTDAAVVSGASYAAEIALFVSIVGLLLSTVAVFFIVRRLTPAMPSDSQGSSQFETFDRLERARVFENDGVTLGYYEERGSRWIMRAPADFHSLVVGPTGTGKTQTVILQSICDWLGSIFVYALKGELIRKTIGHRYEATGHHSDCHVILLALPDASADEEEAAVEGVIGSDCDGGLNPLDIVFTYGDAEEVVGALRSRTGVTAQGGNDEFFMTSANEYLQLVFTWLRHTTPNTASIGEALRHITTQATPQTLLQTILTTPHTTDPTRAWLDLQNQPTLQDPVLLRVAHTLFTETTEDQLKSIIKSATNLLTPWYDNVLVRATSRTTFNPRDLLDKSKNVSVYVYCPYRRKSSLAPVMRVLLHAFLRMVARDGTNSKSSLGRCLVVLDEFDSLGTVAIVRDDINELRGMGITLLLAVQGLNMLYSNQRYTREEPITMACNAQVFLRTNDPESSKGLAERLGKETLRVHPTGRRNVDETGYEDRAHELGQASDMVRIPDDRAIVFLRTSPPKEAGLHPIYAGRIGAYEDEHYQRVTTRPLPWNNVA